MGKDRVNCLLLALIWILTCDQSNRNVKAQDTTFTDVTTVTYSDGPHTNNEDTFNNSSVIVEETECTWGFSAASSRTAYNLRVIWSGNADPNSEVYVSAEKISNESVCIYESVSGQASFSKEYLDLSVCSNAHYDVTIVFSCSTSDESMKTWTPPGPPFNVAIESIKNTSFVVTWSQPAGTGEIQMYNISVRGSNGDILPMINSSKMKTTVSDVQPYTTYYVKVAAKNQDFWGVFSNEKEVTTAFGIAPAPKNLKEASVSNTTVDIQWDEPPYPGPILKYRVSCRNSSGGMREEDTASNATFYTVKQLASFAQYSFKIAALTEAGLGNWSKELGIQTKIGVPYVPKNLKKQSVSNTTVGLKWDEPEVSTGPILRYRVSWKSSGGVDEEDTTSNSTFHTVNQLAPFVRYSFRVLAVTEAGPGNWTEELKIQTNVGVPYAPKNLKQTSVSNTTIGLQWDEPEVSTGPILKYRVSWRSSRGVDEGDTTSNSTFYTVKKLIPFVSYSLKVLAVTEAGPGNWTEELNIQTKVGVPYAPKNLKETLVSNTTVGLKWDEPENSTGPILRYRVSYRSSRGVDEEDTTSNSTFHTVEKLAPFVSYAFRVLAVTKAGPGNWTEELNIQTKVGVPNAPDNLKDTAVSNTTVSLKWEEPTISTGPILRYRILWKKLADILSVEEDTTSNSTYHIMKQLEPYVQYAFKVLALTEAGPGKWSKELVIQTKVGVPHPPTALTLNKLSNTSMDIQWKKPLISTGPIQSYRVYWKNVSISGEENTASNSTFYKLEHLTPYVKYTLKVLALTDAGPGEWSNEIQVQTKTGIPHSPTSFKATSIGNTSVEVQWNKPIVSTGPILKYRISWRNYSKAGEEDTATDKQMYKLNRMTPYTNYTLKILALTDAGPGKWSEELGIQTSIGVPHAPRALTMTKLTNTSISLKWDEPAVISGPLEGYRILWKNSSSSGEEDTKSTDIYYTLKRLTPYTMYTFRVLALTAAGPGERSDEINITTNIGVPPAPVKLALTNVGNTSVHVKWDEPTISTGPIQGYRVYWQNSSGAWEENTMSSSTSYRLEKLTPYVHYTLKILALTEAGPGEWTKALNFQTKIGVPHPPNDLTGSDITNTSTRLTWSEPKPSTGPIMSYSVRWTSSRDSGVEHTKTSEKSYIITSLLPYVNYTFTVLAVTAAGSGEWSRSVKIQTDIGVPTIPRHLRLDLATNVSLFLRWDRPEFPNAPKVLYKLTYKPTFQKDINATEIRILVPSDKDIASYVIHTLLPFTYYSIRVSAITTAGKGPVSEELIAQTEIGVPIPAKILDVKAVKHRTVLVHWTTEGVYPGPVNYSLQAWKYPSLCSSRIGDYNTKELKGSKKAEEWHLEYKTEVTDLLPFGNYSFLILLKTSPTKPIYSQKSMTVRIPPEASSEPVEISAECIGSSTEMKINWKPPEKPNGLISSYHIKYGIENLSKQQEISVKNMCKSQSYILTGLRPERRYRIFIAARVEGVSEDGLSAEAKQVCILPPGIPHLGDTSRLVAKASGPRTLILEWAKDAFSDYMGAIVKYSVLVGRLKSLGNSTSGRSVESNPTWSNFSSGGSDFYQASPPEWNPFNNASDPLECQFFFEMQKDFNRTLLRCFIGVQEKCLLNETYCNGPLQPDTQYEMKIRGFTRGGYTETDPIYARSSPAPKPSVIGKVVTWVMILFLLIVLGVGGFVLKKKGYLDNIIKDIQSRINPKEEPKQEEPEIQMEECNSPKPIKAKKFAEHVRIMMSDSHLQFSLEFERLKNESPQLPCDIAETEDNRSKNRWMNIFPFDHSRVKLLPLCDEPASDFINANYIPGYSSRREYIATQGPLPHTIDDFWRMIWEQSVNMIVMLTQCIERGKKKCEKYWPDSGESTYYGDLRITTVSVSMLSSYIIRIFHIQLGSYERLVKQMHFTHWPDFGCPESPEDLINFVNAVRDHLPRVAPGPILVHCSAGVGRTGTFIIVDRLTLQLRNASNPGEDTVDIYGIVLELRNYRTNMVQTEDQYIYIHLCVRQLIQDRDNSQAAGSQENIYSNVGIEKDSPVPIMPTAPDLPVTFRKSEHL